MTERFCSNVCGGRNPGFEVFGADCTRGWHDGVTVEGCVELVGKDGGERRVPSDFGDRVTCDRLAIKESLRD